MNILMALSQVELTGAEEYAVTVAEELRKRGHKLFYVSDTLTKEHGGLYFKLRFNKRSLLRRLWHIIYLIFIIKKYKIQLVHAHSRASAWSSHVTCKLLGVPMLTTVHGRLHVHASSKKFHAMGDKVIAVSESIEKHLVEKMYVSPQKIAVVRNGINTQKFLWLTPSHPASRSKTNKKVIAIIGRLSGPKGEICYRLLKDCLDLKKYHVKVVSATVPEKRFKAFEDKVEFTGYVEDIPSLLAEADVVVGAGRVAMESLLCGRPTFAIGECYAIGEVTFKNLAFALETNFGDIGPKDLDIDFTKIAAVIEKLAQKKHCNKEVSQSIREQYDLQMVVSRIEELYQDVFVSHLQKEIPVLMYHRFIKNDSQKGVHGTYLDVKMLEKHFRFLKRMRFETLTFEDLQRDGWISRLRQGKRYVIITVDDGYLDSYKLLLPLLKKYQFKAVIYWVNGETFNRWDVEVTPPEKKVLLMNREQIKEMHNSGLVEFGGHSVNHVHLPQLSNSEQKYQISENKKVLEKIIGKPLLSFAYPYGELNEQVKEQVRSAGYFCAVATNSGNGLLHQDVFQIRRIAIFPKTNVFSLRRKISGSYVFYKLAKENNRKKER